jgi:hypothetical protein
VIWEATGDAQDEGGDSALYSRRVSPAMGSLDPIEALTANAAGQHHTGEVAAVSQTELAVAWVRQYGVAEQSRREIVTQRRAVDGIASGPATVASSAGADTTTAPAISAGPDGDFVVVWHSHYQDGSYASVFGRRFDSGGQAVGTEFQVNSYTPERDLYPSVAHLGGGRFVVAWSRHDQITEDGVTRPTRPKILARVYGGDGSPGGDEFQVNRHDDRGGGYARVAAGAHDDFAVVWAATDSMVRLRRFALSPLCGDPDGDRNRDSTDALIVLRAGVGLTECATCVCDVDDSSATTATDALRLLVAVVSELELSCGSCQ